jgi:uncharacterized protein
MIPVLLFALALACAFALGLAVSSGSTCAVAAARDLVHARRAGTMVGFLLAIGIAGIVTLGGKWLFGDVVHLAGDPPIGWPLLVGGVLLGIGATVNGACLFGTLARLGNGELRFVAMPLGLAAGFAIVEMLPGFAPGLALPNPLAKPSAIGWAVMALFAMLLLLAWRFLRQGSDRSDRRTYRWAMLLLGAAGAIEFMLYPGSTFVDAVRMSVLGAMTGYVLPVAATVAAMAGSVISGLTGRTFSLRMPRFALLARSFTGGALMAAGGWLIPGGNDALLLAYLPAATLGGLVAYGIMTVTVLTLVGAFPARGPENGGRGKD